MPHLTIIWYYFVYYYTTAHKIWAKVVVNCKSTSQHVKVYQIMSQSYDYDSTEQISLCWVTVITVCSPVLSMKCLNNWTDSGAPNILLQLLTSHSHCEAMVYHMIHKCCPDFTSTLSMWLASSSSNLSPSSTHLHPWDWPSMFCS